MSFVPELEKRSEKALYRGAQALYNLERYEESAKTLQILLEKFPASEPGKLELSRVRLRLSEQETGNYDFNKMYEATKLRPPLVDCATFRGPVEIRNSGSYGRGLFVTRPVKAGELLLCEKAFSYCFAAPPEEMASSKWSQRSVLLDVGANRISMGTHSDVIRDVSNKLARNPSLNQQFRDMHHGAYKPVSDTVVDGLPVVDT